MLGLDIQNDRMARMVVDQCPITFVPLRDKKCPLRIPSGIGAEDRNFGADIVGGFKASGAKQVRGHGGGGRLAMHSTNDDSLLGGHHRREGIGSTDHRNSETGGFIVGRIAGFDRGGKNHQIGTPHAFSRVRAGEAKTFFGKPLHLDGVHFVRSSDIMSEAKQQRGDPAHSGTRNSNQVDFCWSRTRQKFAEFFSPHFIPSVTARSMTSATFAAAASGESCRAAAAMADRRSGFPSHFERADEKTSG